MSQKKIKFKNCHAYYFAALDEILVYAQFKYKIGNMVVLVSRDYWMFNGQQALDPKGYAAQPAETVVDLGLFEDAL